MDTNEINNDVSALFSLVGIIKTDDNAEQDILLLHEIIKMLPLAESLNLRGSSEDVESIRERIVPSIVTRVNWERLKRNKTTILR